MTLATKGPSSVLPIVEDDETLARALADASVPALMMSMIHLSGDASILDGVIRPKKGAGNVQGHLTEAERAAVIEQALPLLKAYRDRGCTLPPQPDAATLRRMMNFMLNENLSSDYVEMFLEDLALDGVDHHAVEWSTAEKPAAAAGFKVAIIGAGMSGMLAAFRLKQAGIDHVVIEKNAEEGGTWLENRYPGCRVDVPNHFYSFSFEPNHQWPEFYSSRDDLLEYFRRFAKDRALHERIRFNTEVVSAEFDDAADMWTLHLRKQDGTTETISANVMIGAVGQLNRPKLPNLPGIDDFQGPAFHTATWRSDVSLTGKRVAVIGSGASALQLVPEIAKECKELILFQRTPPWIYYNPLYKVPVGEGKKYLLSHVPFYARWYRFLLFFMGGDALLPALKMDPEWSGNDRAISAFNDKMRQRLEAGIREQVGDDEDLLAKVLPDYPPYGNRTLQDNGAWIATLRRPNVTVVADGVKAVTKTGVVDDHDNAYDVDVIVYATGFKANELLYPMKIQGRDGITLEQYWDEEPRAYLGMTVPKFPNMFLLYGPGTNTPYGGSIIFQSECQVRYVVSAIAMMIDKGATEIEIREDTYRQYIKDLDAECNTLVWTHPNVSSYFTNKRGAVVTNFPWRLVDYWKWTRRPNENDFNLNQAA